MLLSVHAVKAQKLVKLQETDQYIEYELRNDSLRVTTPFQITVPLKQGQPSYQVLNQQVLPRKLDAKRLQDLSTALDLRGDSVGVTEVVNPGIVRGQEVATLIINVARPTEEPGRALVTQHLRFRIDKQDTRQKISKSKLAAEDHPLSQGSWFKIPLDHDGIYALDRDYLSELGLNVDGLDPRNIQLWSMKGESLPEVNNVKRPDFNELPVIVTGEDDGSLDAGDRVIFYGYGPNKLTWNSSQRRFEHQLNPYSSNNFVFITVGSSEGKRLQTTSYSNPSGTYNQFQDFVWKENERYKVEDDIKSGQEWYGQKFSTEAGQRSQTIFQDTLAGLVDSEPIQVEIRMIGRSTRILSFGFALNGSSLGNLSMAGISSYNSATGYAGRSGRLVRTQTTSAPDGILDITASVNYSDPNTTGFVDWIRLWATRRLQADNGVLHFASPRNGDESSNGTYILSGFSNQPRVMEVSNPQNPKLLNVRASGSNFEVDGPTEGGHRFVAQTSFFRPAMGQSVAPQNLHGISGNPDYLLVTSELLLDQARSLADYRAQHDGLQPVVVTEQQIFNEFSSGMTDPVAIRDFVRMFYNRALSQGAEPPKYLLLFGNTSFDYKGIHTNARMTNHVITYESVESLHRVYSYAADDFFGMLDPDEGAWRPGTTWERVDIGIGRIPVETPSEAEAFIQKIKTYDTSASLGNWRNLFTFAADDDVSGSNNDRDLHVLNADGTIQAMDAQSAHIRFKKVYEFAYPVENTAEGRRIPQATDDFIRSINNGTLVINYSGHGAEQILSGERLFHSDYIPRFHNRERPTIFVTATCSFGRFDSDEEQSGAEKLMFWDDGGAAAAFTTTRVVYTSSSPADNNFGLNIVLSREMLNRNSNGLPQRLGDIIRKTKNTSIGASFNSRKFMLMGDPAMRFGLPSYETKLTEINGQTVQNRDSTFTLRALDQVQLKGEMVDNAGNRMTNFNGEVEVQVFDAKRTVRLPNRSWLPSCYIDDCSYEVQNDVLFNGRVTVKNGAFDSQFIVPKDISYSDSTGRIMFYARQDDRDGSGSFADVRFNGINPDAANDTKGPQMDVYLNDESFVNGNLVSDQPKLIVDLEDQSGINTTGTGVGHKITATLDAQPPQTFVLNDFYTSDLNDYTSGKIEYPLNDLPNGSYKLSVRAWDVYNNPSEKAIQFEVAQQQQLVVHNIYNYPNPMSDQTRFIFEHNQVGNPLDVNIRIYTLSGRPVTELEQHIVSDNSYASVEWDGRDRDHDRLANGTYIYVLRVKAQTPEGTQTKRKIEKLVIIR